MDFDPAIYLSGKTLDLAGICISDSSGSNSVLKKMGRPLSREGYLSLIHTIRDTIPEAAITTDVYQVFPGETEEDFEADNGF